ncbi:NmrA family NAD(P)-binding protein [Streptomyces sp. NPDC050161]|uniref:NmrA family NAD(P)-binding protein n=1 Tax=Streptomyces sp. NPDC050161 TaxID=3365604 RepID=UPI0037A7EE34
MPEADRSSRAWSAQHLLATADATVTVPTRHPESAHATELAATAPDHVRLVRYGSAALDALIGQADRVFANTDFFATGSAVGEYQQGLHLLAAAERAGVERFIWSALDSAVSLTGQPVPHFDSKAAVAAHIDLMRSEEMLRKETDGWYTDHVSVLTTAPYFENLRDRLTPRPDSRGGLTFRLPLGAAPYPLVALDDTGTGDAEPSSDHHQLHGRRRLLQRAGGRMGGAGSTSRRTSASA